MSFSSNYNKQQERRKWVRSKGYGGVNEKCQFRSQWRKFRVQEHPNSRARGGEDGEGLEWHVRIRPPSLSAKQGLEGGGQSTKCGAALVTEGALGDSMMWVIGGNRSSVALAARVSHVVSHR